MGARMLQAELVVLARMAGPTRRDPRIELGWIVPEPATPHRFLRSEGHHGEANHGLTPLTETNLLPE